MLRPAPPSSDHFSPRLAAHPPRPLPAAGEDGVVAMLSVEEEAEVEPLASPTSSADDSVHTTFKMDLRASVTSSDASRLEDALFR